MEHHRDRFAQAAGEWRDMSFSERIPYEDMARADKDRHQKDLDIASRNLNAALLGSVPKHGACARRSAFRPLPRQLPPAIIRLMISVSLSRVLFVLSISLFFFTSTRLFVSSVDLSYCTCVRVFVHPLACCRMRLLRDLSGMFCVLFCCPARMHVWACAKLSTFS